MPQERARQMRGCGNTRAAAAQRRSGCPSTLGGQDPTRGACRGTATRCPTSGAAAGLRSLCSPASPRPAPHWACAQRPFLAPPAGTRSARRSRSPAPSPRQPGRSPAGMEWRRRGAPRRPARPWSWGDPSRPARRPRDPWGVMGQWRRRSGRQRRWGEVSVGARVGVPLTGAALGGGGQLRCGAVRCGPAPRCRPVLVRCWVRSLVSREKPPRCSRGPCEGYALWGSCPKVAGDKRALLCRGAGKQSRVGAVLVRLRALECLLPRWAAHRAKRWGCSRKSELDPSSPSSSGISYMAFHKCWHSLTCFTFKGTSDNHMNPFDYLWQKVQHFVHFFSDCAVFMSSTNVLWWSSFLAIVIQKATIDITFPKHRWKDKLKRWTAVNSSSHQDLVFPKPPLILKVTTEARNLDKSCKKLWAAIKKNTVWASACVWLGHWEKSFVCMRWCFSLGCCWGCWYSWTHHPSNVHHKDLPGSLLTSWSFAALWQQIFVNTSAVLKVFRYCCVLELCFTFAFSFSWIYYCCPYVGGRGITIPLQCFSCSVGFVAVPGIGSGLNKSTLSKMELKGKVSTAWADWLRCVQQFCRSSDIQTSFLFSYVCFNCSQITSRACYKKNWHLEVTEGLHFASFGQKDHLFGRGECGGWVGEPICSKMCAQHWASTQNHSLTWYQNGLLAGLEPSFQVSADCSAAALPFYTWNLVQQEYFCICVTMQI